MYRNDSPQSPAGFVNEDNQLTSRAGLLTIAQLMQSMQLGEHIDQQFPQPGVTFRFI